MDHNDNNRFNYTYSAKEQAKIKRIREKYAADPKPAEPDKMEQIRRLDADVTKKGTTAALALGILGTLIMGFAMSLIMTDLKEILGVYAENALLIGIIIGFVGMVGIIVAYPLYQHMVSKERKRIAPEILRLTDELLSPNGD